MKSIQTKMLLLIGIALVVLGVVVGGAGIVTVNRLAQRDSDIMMQKTCNEQALLLDNQLQMVVHSVESVYVYAIGELDSVELLQNKNYRDKYLKKIEQLALDITNNTEGSMAVYYHLAPDVVSDGTDGTVGFFWSKTDVDSKMKSQPVTDLLAYDASDDEHVGWYYNVVHKGSATWLDPYFNQNVGVDMISYVIPVYVDRRLIGVVGIDVDFSLFVEFAEGIHLYETGGSNLVNMGKQIIYYRDKEQSQVKEDKLPAILSESIMVNGDSPKAEVYQAHGKDVKLVYKSLVNQMKLVFYADADEIDRNRDNLLKMIILWTVAIIAVTMIICVIMVHRIVTPLEQLTVAAEQFAEGNWEMEITCHTSDEVKRLTDSISAMAAKTRDYINEINIMAYKDGLTGIKNKSYYMEFVELLKKRSAEKDLKYAIILFDVNGLKKINDNRGHEYGDKLLIAASKYICMQFRHSPIFRIGGDEFVAILENGDYENRYDLLESFRLGLAEFEVFEGDDYRLSIASGIAEYPQESKVYEELFQVADERMYINKRIMKGERTE